MVHVFYFSKPHLHIGIRNSWWGGERAPSCGHHLRTAEFAPDTLYMDSPPFNTQIQLSTWAMRVQSSVSRG